MKQNFTYIILAAIVAALLLTACRKDEYETPHMTLTTSSTGNVEIYLGGSGEATIDWGDGTPSETYTFAKENSLSQSFRHSYSIPPPHVITITGDNITELSCNFQNITSLDVSRNTALTYLTCNFNQLTNLDLSKNTALTELWCHSNQLTRLDVRNTALRDLNCNSNQLTRLDLSKNTALTTLQCSGNQLSNLDVSKNTTLTYLQCEQNRLTSLDVNRNTALTYLNCNANLLTILDLSKNTKLTSLSCGNNQLTSLDVGKNTTLTYLYCGANNLQADALNALFNSLSTVADGRIRIGGNPGADACDRSIATDKGWRVFDFYL